MEDFVFCVCSTGAKEMLQNSAEIRLKDENHNTETKRDEENNGEGTKKVTFQRPSCSLTIPVCFGISFNLNMPT